jgi:amino acid transporter
MEDKYLTTCTFACFEYSEN